MNATTIRIYELLAETPHWQSGEQLGHALGISRGAVAKHVGQLRERGCVIEAVSRRGYRFVSAPDAPEAFAVVPLLTTRVLGRHLIYLDETDWTNREAARLAQAGAAEGTVVVAAAQTAGRGRFQRHWHSQPGLNLTFSLLLRPSLEPARIPQLPILAAAALLPALDRVFGDTPSKLAIKWPNDILADGRKLCGILCECETEADLVHHIILGIGINVNSRRFPVDLRETATSLALETGRSTALAPLLADILNSFEPLYLQWCGISDLAPFLPLLMSRSHLRGRDLAISGAAGTLHGRFSRILPDGRLEIEAPEGLTTVHSGDVTLKGTP
ncbi:biotin--[acetyl-CoA-carboxylase] ligase [Desulfonatronum sp. SC1]|uniref:biotin--[acetyl-CoA-carboxylase] ligase n=1 Tax=Desulfonatronum sp. SC1 TaxID=2109626 RepID=UPI000D31DCC3|nr:biotin--[acetyl-CoA-carboxylase] ligase [Desulfonatronum sp. SC1]PTN36990.1 biotin--[acetyl-CoA-carboxylase] ligase [Desulfonatronum sp. SC1]